jgi:hypothetical protein
MYNNIREFKMNSDNFSNVPYKVLLLHQENKRRIATIIPSLFTSKIVKMELQNALKKNQLMWLLPLLPTI